jgi:tripartite-type tricarboxylate transporter receptor subunit TctC
VKLILPYAPGGATDFIGRPWADALSKAYGQPFVIDNRGGAAGGIGTEAAAKSAPDGYTFLLTPAGPLTVLPHLRKMNYEAKDLVSVARVGDLVCGFTILPDLGIKSIKELVDYAKANPGKLAYGSAGLGSSAHMRIEMLKYRTGIDILHVPYRGSADALNDLLAKQVQLMNEINVIPHVKQGKLTLLAINYPTRHPDFPNVPTLTEAGVPNADVPIWYAVYAPAGTPKEIIDSFNKKAVEIANTPEMKTRMQEINVIVPPQTPEEIEKFRVADSAANAELIKAANVKLE